MAISQKRKIFDQNWDFSPTAVLKIEIPDKGAVPLKKESSEIFVEQLRVLAANKAALQLFKVRRPDELKPLCFQLAPLFWANFGNKISQSFPQESRYSLELLKYKSGSRVSQYYQIKAGLVLRSRPEFLCCFVSFEDVTALKASELRLQRMAQIDGLTQLYNYRTILKRLEEEFIRAKRYNLTLSCLMMDLDYFKSVNDRLGHQKGDQVLKRVAFFLKEGLRRTDIIGRYGGDEFLIILTETKVEYARLVAVRLQEMLAKRMGQYLKGFPVPLGVSIGSSGYPGENLSTFKDMIALADKELYQAKSEGHTP